MRVTLATLKESLSEDISRAQLSQLNMTWKRDDSPVNTSKQDSKRAPPARIAIDRAFYNFFVMLLIWSKLEYNKS